MSGIETIAYGSEAVALALQEGHDTLSCKCPYCKQKVTISTSNPPKLAECDACGHDFEWLCFANEADDGSLSFEFFSVIEGEENLGF